MSDLGRDGAGAAGEDRLPWLEPVDDVDAPQDGVAAGKLLAAVLIALVAIGLIIGGSFWLRQRNVEVAEGGPATIPAPPGPYKVKPAAPGGMQVPGQGDASYSASTGADPNAAIDLDAVPEAPVKPGAPSAPPAPPAPAKPAATAKADLPSTPKALPAAPALKPTQNATAAIKPAPVPAPAAPAAATGGPAIQLGAFSSQAKANAAWKSLAQRFAYLAPLAQQVVPATVGNGTVYRLRASAGSQAKSICAKLKVAGETCLVTAG